MVLKVFFCLCEFINISLRLKTLQHIGLYVPSGCFYLADNQRVCLVNQVDVSQSWSFIFVWYIWYQELAEGRSSCKEKNGNGFETIYKLIIFLQVDWNEHKRIENHLSFSFSCFGMFQKVKHTLFGWWKVIWRIGAAFGFPQRMFWKMKNSHGNLKKKFPDFYLF